MTKQEFDQLLIGDLLVVTGSLSLKGTVVQITSTIPDGFAGKVLMEHNNDFRSLDPWPIKMYTNYSKFEPSNIFSFLYL